MTNKCSKLNRKNAGTTLVEIVVSFALLGIFMAAAAMIISNIAGSYFNVKGETYSKQVTDIVFGKMASAIEGAKYRDKLDNFNPSVSDNYSRITLRDRTGTKVSIYAENGEIRFFYAQINDETDQSKNREATVWRFDDAVYNGYSIENLCFVPGNELGTFGNAEDYGMNTSACEYGDDVIVLFMKMNNPKYGDYYTYRVVKMFYVPDSTEEEGGGTPGSKPGGNLGG